MTTLSPETIRPHRLNFAVYVLSVVLLYVGDLVAGVWVLFTGLPATVAPSSFLFWLGAWALCYIAYRRSKNLGYALTALTVILTVLIIVGVFLIALFFGVIGDE